MKKQLGNFEIVEKIDPGGFTTVYRAIEHMGQGVSRPVALKVLRTWNLDDELQLAILRREVEVLIELGNCPNIVTIHGFGIGEESGGDLDGDGQVDLAPWIAMGLAGPSLKHFIADEPAEPDDVRVLLRDVLRALVTVHGTDPPILHRDLKPPNILSTDFGVWQVTDFGLAKRRGADETLNLVTVQYAAPELLDATLGEESPRMDLYALGMTAYEYALGRTLYRQQFPSVYDPYADPDAPAGDERPKWMYWHTSPQMTVPPVAERIPDYPQDLSDLIAGLTAKLLEERIESASEALGRLGRVEGTARPAEVLVEAEEEQQRPLVAPGILLALVAVLLLVGAGGFMLLAADDAPVIEFANNGEFFGQQEEIPVTCTIKSFPANGRARVVLKDERGSGYVVTASEEGKDQFRSQVKLTELRRKPAELMVYVGSSEIPVARKPLFVKRLAPDHVKVILDTSVPEVEVVITPSDRDLPEVVGMTNGEGRAEALTVPYGSFDVRCQHPSFVLYEAKNKKTGHNPEKVVPLQLTPISKEELYRQRRALSDRLLELARRKAKCEPDLTPEEQVERESVADELNRLAHDDPATRVWVRRMRQVKCGDPAPEEPEDPSVKLKQKAYLLVTKKARCSPRLTGGEESELAGLLDELDALAFDDVELQRTVQKWRAVKCGDPEPEDPSAKLKQRAYVLVTKKARCSPPLTEEEESELTGLLGKLDAFAFDDVDLQRRIRDWRAVKCGDPEPQAPTIRGRGSVTQRGAGGSSEAWRETGGGGTEAWRESAGGGSEVIDSKALVLSLGEFRDFIERNVPSGALRVEAIPELNQVRLSGVLYTEEELRRLARRLAPIVARMQLELKAKPWPLCRLLESSLTAAGASEARVTADLTPGDETIYVQFAKSDGFSHSDATRIAQQFVIDRDLLVVQEPFR